MKKNKGKKERGEKDRRICFLFLRYAILILVAFSNLWLFYFIFNPLTIYPVSFFLKLFFPANLTGTTIILKDSSIQLVRACIAGSAYYLLLILNLTTPMSLKKRIPSIIFSFSAFLFINIIRILIFSVLFLASFSFFNLIHLIFWYFLSSFIVFLIWIINIKIFKIRAVPIYTDLRFLYGKIKEKGQSK
jgi:hypothetical protein